MMITKLFKSDLTMPSKIVPKYTGSKLRHTFGTEPRAFQLLFIFFY